MLATAMDKANDELGLTAFKTPEEYMELDDYTVWAAPKNAKHQTKSSTTWKIVVCSNVLTNGLSIERTQ